MNAIKVNTLAGPGRPFAYLSLTARAPAMAGQLWRRACASGHVIDAGSPPASTCFEMR